MKTLRGAWFFSVLLAVLFSVGCVRVDVKPPGDTRLIVTRGGDFSTLTWESRPGMAYTVWFTASRGAGSSWSVLPGAERIRGTGSALTWRDRATGERYYRLVAQPLARKP